MRAALRDAGNVDPDSWLPSPFDELWEELSGELSAEVRLAGDLGVDTWVWECAPVVGALRDEWQARVVAAADRIEDQRSRELFLGLAPRWPLSLEKLVDVACDD